MCLCIHGVEEYFKKASIEELNCRGEVSTLYSPLRNLNSGTKDSWEARQFPEQAIKVPRDYPSPLDGGKVIASHENQNGRRKG